MITESISKLYDVGVRVADSIATPIKIVNAQIGPVYDGVGSVKQTLCDRIKIPIDHKIDMIKSNMEYAESKGRTETPGYKGLVEDLKELEACSGSIPSYVQQAGEKITEGVQKIGSTASDIVRDNSYQAADKIADISDSDSTGIILGVIGAVSAGITGVVLYTRSKNNSSQTNYDDKKTSNAV